MFRITQWYDVDMTKLTDLSGKRFNRLQVISKQTSHNGRTMWLCLCDCGNKKLAEASNLKRNLTGSCGCLHRELTAKSHTTHGMRHTVEYNTWARMKGRCENTKSKDYPRWGGRGIKVCKRWESFDNFFADMGKRPSTKHSLDRIDNNKNYQPSNCRWADAKTQANNRRRRGNLILVKYQGITKPLIDWADTFGINYSTIQWRYKQGWQGDRLFHIDPKVLK
jgi:hypothetical protein